MKNIKDLVPKPSDAVKAMIDGLEKFGNPETTRGKFKIEMWSFGHKEDGICFGCAATCAAMMITGKPFTKFTDPYDHDTKFKIKGLDEFECVINNLRQGSIYALKNFYTEFFFSYTLIRVWKLRWDMDTDNWQKEMPEVKKFYDYLIANGL